MEEGVEEEEEQLVRGEESDKFPWRAVGPIVLVTMAEGFQGSVLVPFVAFMVHDLTGTPLKRVGVLAGAVTTAFFLGQLLGTFAVGRLSDRIGRKPVLLFGLVANAVTAVAFGFSFHLAWAVAWRLLNGILNGSVGVVKSYVRESSSVRHQATAFGLRSAGYSIGMILGPLCGGILSRPHVQWPSLFPSDEGLFVSFPYLLPCLVSILVNLICFVLTVWVMPETVPNPEGFLTVVASSFSCIPWCKRRGYYHMATLDTTEEIALQDPAGSGGNGGGGSTDDDDDAPETAARGEEEAASPQRQMVAPSLPPSGWTLIKEKNILTVMMLYAGIGLNQVSYLEVFAFWAILPATEGYLGFREVHIGALSGACAVFVLAWQLLVFPWLDRRFGSLLTLRMALLVSGPCLMAFPYIRFMRPALPCLWPLETCGANSGAARALHYDGLIPPPFAMSQVAFWSVLGIASVIIRVGFVMHYSGINVIIANMSPSNMVGATNGLSAAFAAASRCAAPIVAGSIFSASAHFDVFPIDASLVFLLCGVLSLILFVASFRLGNDVNERRMTPL